jgi:C4-dicarboxylate-specific signal transduction histidine kinase
VYLAEKKYDLAQPFFEEALAILEQYHDTDSPSLSVPLNNLALIYRSKGEYAKAKECSERALLLRNPDIFSSNYAVIQEEFRQLEEKAKESERLSYLGSMATGIAHNINNPTGIISLKAQRGLRRVKQDNLSRQEAEELFSGILHEAERLHNIIKRFQDFAKGDRTKRENIDLNVLVQRVADYFSGQFQSHDVALNLELADSNPQAYANQFVVEEVLINLMTNAREEVEKRPRAAVWVKTSTTSEHGVIQVEDNGSGVLEEQQKNLFSPFHSTKAHGTGLGLHFAKSALERISGTISYHNRADDGACFMVKLLPPQ